MTNEGSGISGSENEGPILFALGFLFIMLSLAGAITIGTSLLITPVSGMDYSSYTTGSFMIILLFSPLGGFLLSQGLRLILKESRS